MKQAVVTREGIHIFVNYEYLSAETDVGACEEVNVMAVLVNGVDITKLISLVVLTDIEDELLGAHQDE